MKSLFIVLVFTIFGLTLIGGTAHLGITTMADPETLRCYEDFLKDFRPGEITAMPFNRGPIVNDIIFLYRLATGQN